ncbi:Copper chaperone domain-containing protein [Dioscorea alata]|uniref:Copper chaperone domain-containing protein n=1 Tax=Dioscorea alata TaxID=55571 RepID=A0ACB7V908_DIOAL|nr:Copper chaperone domain-containing protein [Dioscorea alata]
MGARTDDNLKIIELKVSVNCCEGCKRKVLKALSIKGVLKTEIHPSQPKLTVYGSVDPQTLIKKLSRCGKTAELCSSEETKLPKIPATTTTAVDKEQQTKSYSNDAGGKQNSSLNDTKSSNNNNNNNNKNKDGDEISNKVKETSGSVAAQVVPEEANTMFATPVVTTVPPMSYVVGPNPNMVHNPGGNVMASSHARVYYPMEPHTVLPVPYYTTVSTHYTAPPPPCYIPEHYQYEMPIYRTPPPPMQQQPMGFSDYFNDDNTVGCHVM